jgi:tetratricopeptide (TPR) repeat protein
MGQHLTRALLVRLLSGVPGVEHGELDRAAYHALTCKACWQTVAETARELRDRGVAMKPGPVFQALIELTGLERSGPVEALKAKGRWLWLQSRGLGERTTELRSNPALRTWELMLVLMEEADRLSRADPGVVEDVITFALRAAELLPAGLPALANDCRADLWASRGNAKRLLGDWKGAAGAFKLAESLREEGSGDPLQAARITGLEASLEIDLGRTEAGLKLLEKARILYEESRDWTNVAKVAIQHANALRELRPGEAIRVAGEALRLLPEDEWRLRMLARGIVIEATAEDGRPDEALLLLQTSRRMFAQFREPTMDLRVKYLEARILHSRGEASAAERFYKNIIASYEELELYKDVFLNRLYLFGFYLSLGKVDQALHLCTESIALLRQVPVHAQMRAVWSELKARHQARTIDGEQLYRVRDYLVQHWRVPAPKLPFEPACVPAG